jgi:hypothetical protein
VPVNANYSCVFIARFEACQEIGAIVGVHALIFSLCVSETGNVELDLQ